MNNKYGFSIIEVLVASIIILVGSLTVLTLLANGSSLNKDLLIRRRVVQEMERTLEKPTYSYKSPDYITLPTQAYTVIDTVVLDDMGTTTTALDDMKAVRWIKVESTTYTINGISIPAKIVTVRVNWTQGQTAMSDSLSTILTLVDAN